MDTPEVINELVSYESDGLRLDMFVAHIVEGMSRSAAQKLIEKGSVQLNGSLCTSKSCKLCLGDKVQVVVERPQHQDEVGFLTPNPIELDIRYEDEYLLVISKQKGLVCHPAPGHENDTLANALVARYGYEHLGHLQGDERPGIVHRLDMDTTGLMLCAKDDATQKALQDLIRMRTLDRRYVVLVHGYVAPDSGMIDASIARSKKDRLKMSVSDDIQARSAITTFTTLERFEAGAKDEGYSLLECHLYTGRTHQIRVHMRHISHAVVGDPLYGHGSQQANLGLDRQFLHSWRVQFDHPMKEKTIELCDFLPQDLYQAYKAIQPRSMGKTTQGEKIINTLIRQSECE